MKDNAGQKILIQNHFLDLFGLEKEPKMKYVLTKKEKERVGTLGKEKEQFQLEAQVAGKNITAQQTKTKEGYQIHFQIMDGFYETKGTYSLKKGKSLKHALSWITFYDGAFYSEIELNQRIFTGDDLFLLRTPQHFIHAFLQLSPNPYGKEGNPTKIIHVSHEQEGQLSLYTKYSEKTGFAFFNRSVLRQGNVFDEKDLWFLRTVFKKEDPDYYHAIENQVYILGMGDENFYLNSVSKCFKNKEDTFQKVLFNCFK